MSTRPSPSPLLESCAGIEILLKETAKLIAFYQGCSSDDLFCQLDLEPWLIRLNIGKCNGWLAANVPIFRPMKDLPPCRWLELKYSMPPELNIEWEQHHDAAYQWHKQIEEDAQMRIRQEDFDHQLRIGRQKAGQATLRMIETLQKFEAWLCERLDRSNVPREPEIRNEGELTKQEKALALLVANPELSNSEIADRVGVARTTLNKRTWKRFQAARKALKAGKGDLPRGTKNVDDKHLEAWEEEE